MSIKQKFIDLVIRGKDLFSPSANKATEELRSLQAESREASTELKQLEKTQADLARARGLELYAEQAEKALAGARAEVTRLAREMDSGGKATKEQSENLSAARRSANQLQTEYNKLTSQLTRSKTELKQNGIDTRNLASEQNRLQNEVKQSTEQLLAKRSRLAQLRAELNNATKSTGAFGSSLGGLTSRLLAFAGAYVGLQGIKTAITDIFTAGDQFDRLKIQLTGVMGSIEAGEQASAWIEEFARKTPLQLTEVTESFVRLKNFGLDPMDGTMQAIIDQSEKLGGGYERVRGISLALGQAWAKQKLQGEEILQLIERGVPVWQLLENVTGKNTSELQKLSSAGQLGRDVMKQLIDEIGRAAEGQAQKGMQTMTGLVSNLRDNITRFYVLISQSGAMDALKEQLNAVNQQFERMAADGTLKAAADKIAEFIGSAVKTTGEGLNGMLANISGFISTISFITNTIKILFNGLSSAMFLTASAFTKFISLMLKSWGTLADFVGANNIAESLAQQAGAINAVSDAYFKQFEQDAADIKTAWDGITNAVAASSNAVTKTVVDNAAKQAAANDYVTQREQARIEQQAKLQQAIAASGIVTLDSLRSIEETARTSYEAIKEAADAGQLSAYEVEQAYVAWAEASLKVTEATKGVVPEVMRLEAAELGLGLALDDLIKKQGLSVEFSDAQGRSVSVLRKEIDKTLLAVSRYQDILESSTSTTEQKRIATEGLLEAQNRLQLQQQALQQVQELSNKTYFAVKQALETAKREADRLTNSYEAGAISASNYNEQLNRQLILIQALQGLMGGAGDQTEQHGDQQQQTGQQVENTTESVERQSVALQNLSDDADEAKKYTSLLAEAQKALQTEFDLTEKSTGDLNKRMDELTGYIRINQRVTSMWWVELARASNEAFTREKQIISETLTMRKYIEQVESGTITMRQLNAISHQMNIQFSRLGANELEPLRRAITDAEQRLLSFRDGLQGTVQGLQDEIDRLNNNQAAIEKRRYEAQVAELQAKLKQAQESGDQQSVAAAKEALRLAKEIYQIKTNQFKAEKQASGQSANQSTAPIARPATESPGIAPGSALNNSSSQPSGNSGPVKTVRLVLDIGGNSFGADMENNEATRFLSQVERARSTSL
ncbi:tape measure protein [Arsukibacterium indicum]|uniref:Tape measure protein n=1 Tax=Arsukibacterium indicum TaxID=2848612 RepID=A0ABS6MGZ9_9GAMM|nr:tape measure protein [Arsukibacterium indicum]MBV2127920.1 tape measure protein [Arsukibacterium indicum]